MTTNTFIVECDSCGQKNRVLRNLPPGKVAQCGKCHEELDAYHPDDIDADDEDEAIDDEAGQL